MLSRTLPRHANGDEILYAARMRQLLTIACALAVLPALPAGSAQAEDDGANLEARDPNEARTYVNVRGGFASSNQNGRPDVCLEVAPIAFLSAEACGTGAQVWHNDPEAEVAHFRLKGRLLSLPLPRFWLQAFVGAGFAELSVAKDEPGLVFRGASESLASTAGAELTIGTRALIPLAHGLEMIGDLSFSAAYLPHADELVVPQSRFLPTAAFSLGLGF